MDKLDWDFDYLIGAQLSQSNGCKDGHVSRVHAAGLKASELSLGAQAGSSDIRLWAQKGESLRSTSCIAAGVRTTAAWRIAKRATYV